MWNEWTKEHPGEELVDFSGKLLPQLEKSYPGIAKVHEADLRWAELV